MQEAESISPEQTAFLRDVYKRQVSMFISEEQFLQAISNMMDKKLDARLCEMPTKAELDARLSEMPTKAELDARLSEVPTKAELDARLSKMPSKKEMADSLYRLENNLLEELDIVQEKAVSYTHLDVYKRQHHGRAGRHTVQCSCACHT